MGALRLKIRNDLRQPGRSRNTRVERGMRARSVVVQDHFARVYFTMHRMGSVLSVLWPSRCCGLVGLPEKPLGRGRAGGPGRSQREGVALLWLRLQGCVSERLCGRANAGSNESALKARVERNRRAAARSTAHVSFLRPSARGAPPMGQRLRDSAECSTPRSMTMKRGRLLRK